MKPGYRNISSEVKNKGLSNRSKSIVKKELLKASRKNLNSHEIDSQDMLLFKKIITRKCSCLNTLSSNDDYEDIDDFSVPIINLGDSSDDIAVSEALDFLDQQKETCCMCYGTGYVGGYKLVNTYEWYIDSTFGATLHDVDIFDSKPDVFKPESEDAYIIAQVSIPMFYDELIFKAITAEGKVACNVVYSLDNIAYIDIDDACEGSVYLKFFVEKDVHGFMLRAVMGTPSVKVNFPFMDLTITDGTYDYWDTVSVVVGPKQSLSTEDVLIGEDSTVWRVTNVSPQTKFNTDLGKEANLRKIRDYEVFKLLL